MRNELALIGTAYTKLLTKALKHEKMQKKHYLKLEKHTTVLRGCWLKAR